MSSANTRPGPWPRGFVLRACALAVAGAFPGVAALASVPGRPSGQGLLLYAALTVPFLLAVPLLAALGTLTGLARGALAGVLPRIRFGAGAADRPAPGLRTAAGVFNGQPGLGGLLDELRNGLARRGPPAAGRAHAI